MKFINGMANISIKSARLTPFRVIFSIVEQIDCFFVKNIVFVLFHTLHFGLFDLYQEYCILC